MDPLVAAALRAVDEAERAVLAEPAPDLSPQYLADVAAVMALEENQEGAEKGGVWRAYEWCIRHFQNARRIS